MSRIHLVGISADSEVQKRIQTLAAEFQFSCENCTNIDDFAEKYSDHQVVMTVVSATDVDSSSDITGRVQVTRQIAAGSFILVLVNKKISPTVAAFVKKSGADIVINVDNFFNSCHLEFLCSQVIKGSLVPLKIADIKENSTVDFPILYFMPMNKKILPVVRKGTTLSADRLQKLQQISEFYVSREDLPALQTYLEVNQDPTAKGLMSRCRIQYLNLCAAHTKLIMLLIDESEQSSFAEGKRLLDACSSLAQNLLSNLGTVEDPWGIVDQSSFGQIGSVERSTSIASFAGLVNLSLEAPEGPETVIAGLLSDIGLLDQHPAAAQKLRDSRFSDFNAEELKSYRLHPITSINRCLSRKLPIPDNIKNIILCTHETRDQKGFPNQVTLDKIPLGAMILQFCELVDSLAIVKMGQQKRTIKEIQAQIIAEEQKNSHRFDLAFLDQLKKKYC